MNANQPATSVMKEDLPYPYPSGYRMFSDAQLESIHLATLEVLQRTGVRVYEAECLELLGASGCDVMDDNLVRFPPNVVEMALQSVPSRVVLCDRTGTPRMQLEGHRTYFGTGSDLPNTRDLESGERRPSLIADVGNVARLVDALPNIDFTMSMALPADVPVETADRYSFQAMMENTVKPIVFTAWDEAGLVDIIAMAEAVAGGSQELQLKPFLLAYLEPTSPLRHTEAVLRKMLRMVDKSLPFVYAPGPLDGATAPVTPAGALVITNAEVVSGVVIAQQRRPGTPVVWGCGSGPLDMRTMVSAYSAPEFMLNCMGMAELAHYYYQVPVWGFSGCSDSKNADMQAGIDSALWIMWTALSGANLVHDVGYIESGLTCSYEMIAISDEIISFVRRLLRGIDLSPEQMALEAIREVGPGGNYLGAAHTARHFRQVWYPRLADRRAYAAWVEAGQPTMVQNAGQLARELIAKHRAPAISESALETVRTIVREADARAGVANPSKQKGSNQCLMTT
jgi:trimethylamine---corrinoid protein Co-methyltransferase